MNSASAYLIVSLLVGVSLCQKVFYVGTPPKFNQGVLRVHGYYASEDQNALVLPDSTIQESNHMELEERDTNEENEDQQQEGFPDTEPRKSLLSKGNKNKNPAETRVLLPVPVAVNAQVTTPNVFSPFRITDSVTVTNVVPPICIACSCLQAAQTCAAAGGVQLISQTLTIGGTAIGPTNPVVPIFTGLTAPNSLACAVSVNGAAFAPLATVTTLPAASQFVLNCIVPPPATLSVCDSSCRVNSGGATTLAGAVLGQLCASVPSTATCPPFPTQPVCNTPCQNLSVGATVPCNNAFPSVISQRPTTLCPNVQKREVKDSEYPDLESTIEAETGDRRGRYFGFSVARTTFTRTSTVSGTVTATYVANGACLPSNLIGARNC